MERSFYTSARFEINQVILLLSSVSYDYVKKIPVKKFRDFVDKIIGNKNEEYAFRIWSSAYPFMTQENYIPFDEFYKKKKKEKSIEEARKEIAEAVQAFEEVGD
ncbi:hypothetical protein [Anaerorhabdus furcosa]|uniref:Uncharacterized protein n=1 Tax=Anaerorhabdus furcosa TaxID=118967 RepID=A0A1T4M2B2_9FIRM|nr:hypothetical protein [Anaerorhabdus furcosa]SJZ60844.1 hypothetical protein SAMN02745191_1144 [Anaerorhabdus furcosa]